MKKNKVLAILLALVMLVSILPVYVFAAPEDDVVILTPLSPVEDNETDDPPLPEAPSSPGEGDASPDPVPPSLATTERVYIAMAAASGANAGYVEVDGYREYANAYWLDGDSPTTKASVKTTTAFPLTGADTSQGAYNPPTFIGAGIYLLEFDEDGIAIAFEKLPFDPYTSYGAPNTLNNTIRIGNWGVNGDGNKYNTYKYDKNTKVYFVTGTNAALELAIGSIEDLEEDWNDTIRIFYDDDKLLTEVFITAADGAGSVPTTDQSVKWVYSEGIRWNDTQFGYDGFENPYPVQFALYNPINDATNTGASDPDALYPLYIYIHGSGGGGSKTGIVSGDVTPYITAARQEAFVTGTEGVTGAYVMAPRANEFVNSAYGGALAQSWLHGYKKDANPHFAAGDEDYKGKPTQCDALIANILWLIENENIDPDRIYLTGNSAGGYMTWETLFEAARLGYGDLFAAALPNVAAFFPEGIASDLYGNPNLNELGLQSKVEAVKDVPIWMFYGENDFLCTPHETYAIPYTVPGLNGTDAWYKTIASLSDGKSPVQGSPLTRVTIVKGMNHESTPIRNNNLYPSGANTGHYYSEDFDAASAGANMLYSSGSYTDTIIDWLNAAGNAKAGIVDKPEFNNTVVKTERVYVAMATGNGAFSDSVEAVSNSNINSQALTSNGNIRTFNNAFFLDGNDPTAKAELKVATDCIAVVGRPVTGLGPYQGNWIGAVGIYEFGFNAEGIAVTFTRLLFDPYTGYGAPDMNDGTIRIGQFGNMDGDIHNTYKFDGNTKVYIVAGSNATLTLTAVDIEDLILDNNDTVRIFFDYKSMTDRTLTEVFITETAGEGNMAATYSDRYWSEGVNWDDADFGYDGIENPYPVQFSLYDPVVHGGKNDEAKYPLVIYFHGNGGAGSKTGVAGASTGYNYVTRYNDEFETNTKGVNGAFVMAARAVAELTTPGMMGGQSWLNGYRYDSNPRYALGDEEYMGKPTQQAALIANVEWLIANNDNIDTNRIYLISQSAGGYMVIQTLFEAARLGKDDLFDGAIMHKGAFFPSGMQLKDDYSEVELGLEDKLLSIRNVPLWAVYSVDDTTCTWAATAGSKFTLKNDYEFGMTRLSIAEIEALEGGVTMDKIGGAGYLWEAIANLKDIPGTSELTRFSALVGGAHASTTMDNNNTYPASTAAREGVTPTYYTAAYGTMPEGFNEMNPGSALAYTFGAHPQYSTGSYEESFTSWLNACGNLKSAPRASLSGDTDVVTAPDATASYKVSITGAPVFNVAELTLEIDGEYFETESFEGMDGFVTFTKIVWVYVGNDKWQTTISLGKTGGTSSGDFDLFDIMFSLRGLIGTTEIKLISCELAYLNDSYACVIEDGTVTTNVGKYYSPFDVNKSGAVDKNDFSWVVHFFMVTEQDEAWNNSGEAINASACDVDGDGIIDISDIILILANYSK